MNSSSKRLPPEGPEDPENSPPNKFGGDLGMRQMPLIDTDVIATSTIASNDNRAREEVPYRRSMEKWPTECVLSNKPRVVFQNVPGTLPFSEELEPMLQHELVRNRDPATSYDLLARRYLNFCWFTERLEIKAVIPICSRIACSEAGFYVPPALASDCRRTIADEADHADRASDQANEIMSALGIAEVDKNEPAFWVSLQSSTEGLDQRHKHLAQTIFTVVSETLISSTLSKVPADRRVNPFIRELVLDHARDEARHAGIFSQVMERMWAELSAKDKDLLGPRYAWCLAAFLEPDQTAQLRRLISVGFSDEHARRIIQETAEATDRATFRKAAAPTIGLMRRFGLLNHAATFDALVQRDLLLEE